MNCTNDQLSEEAYLLNITTSRKRREEVNSTVYKSRQYSLYYSSHWDLSENDNMPPSFLQCLHTFFGLAGSLCAFSEAVVIDKFAK
jgi:hypothetical protein